MTDERSLYIYQLLNHYRDNSVIDSVESYMVRYQYVNGKPLCRHFRHNEGIEFIKQYIKDLENKVNELQYIERVVQAATRDEAIENRKSRKEPTYETHY